MKQIFKLLAAGLLSLPLANPVNAQEPVNIQKQNPRIENRTMSPEVLWAMGRIGGYAASPDGSRIVYNVAYYSVKENKSHHVLYVMNSDGTGQKKLTTSAKSETDAAWLSNDCIAFLTGGQLWTMKADGTERRQVTHDETDIEGFKFAPDQQHVILLKSLPYHGSIKENPSDLPKATGRLVTDMNYRHWDHYVESITHPFVASVTHENGVLKVDDGGRDILEGEPYECPTAPFGGIEQLDWSTDSKQVAYTCRKKEGVEYAISTDTDIYLYNIDTRATRNLCKSGIALPKSDPTKTMQFQPINSEQYKNENVGYDTNPRFSPDGRYVAWLSMERDGYESDRNRLCIYDLQAGTKKYVSEQFDSNVDDYCWTPDSKSLYFIGVWHATENLYRTNLKGEVVRLTDEIADFGSLQMLGKKQIVAERHDYFHPADLYVVTPGKDIKSTKMQQITEENKHILDGLDPGSVKQRWVKTTDGGQMLYWVILPPHFDPTKKYPTLLFCEGGPQSPVSQFWSYRWNFYIMASQGYVIIAPNRHGLPGFGSKWCEQISGDWTGQCMNDYLTAIDDAAQNLPYVDRDRMGAVGASFGGFSVYYLAGHHDKRFKCFIAHDGAFNLESMYTDTEEVWFSNWEYDDAYWNKDQTARAKKTYDNSPHRFVDQWDTPILCIHGEMDYRINANQGMGAFNAARLRGIPAELLIFPDENHWVLKPQNGILWQRTYFEWLDRWLKK
ncbi:MAG: S9 family peptidase [Bacteroidaceae bacterium]|nr:S9 family peptidase [Bacteroidaceae bacterium]